MKPKIILKSLGELPATALALLATGAGRVRSLSELLPPPAVRQGPARRYGSPRADFANEQPWSRGGLNE